MNFTTYYLTVILLFTEVIKLNVNKLYITFDRNTPKTYKVALEGQTRGNSTVSKVNYKLGSSESDSSLVIEDKYESTYYTLPPNYDTVAKYVIIRLEGGYYHPNMLKRGIVKDKRYGSSGETFFGIDRKNGGSLAETPQWDKFWGIIDGQDASHKWKWRYKGGEYNLELRKLASEMIKYKFNKRLQKYVDKEVRDIVWSDERLLFHMIYATWNGSGWFRKFGRILNKAYKKGVRSPEKLFELSLNARLKSRSSLIRQGGRKIKKFFQERYEKVDIS